MSLGCLVQRVKNLMGIFSVMSIHKITRPNNEVYKRKATIIIFKTWEVHMQNAIKTMLHNNE